MYRKRKGPVEGRTPKMSGFEACGTIPERTKDVHLLNYFSTTKRDQKMDLSIT